MNGKRLSALCKAINIRKCFPNSDPLITGLAYDSRQVKAGFVFFALKGLHTDGHNFIEKAVQLGAAAVFYSDEIKEFPEGAVYIQVDDTRKSMSPAAAAFYDYPSLKLKTAGITGTDGKSTTVYLTDQLIELAGFSCGFISTVNFKTGKEITGNPYRQSTPEAVEIQAALAEMLKNGKTHAVIEATSHGLSEINSRLKDVVFDAAVFTNITHEHLEFHKTFENYKKDKSRLFAALEANSKENTEPFGVVNLDDPEHEYFIKAAAGRQVFTYSIKNSSAALYAADIKAHAGGTEFTLNWKGQSLCTHIRLPGIFNVENTLAALLAASGLTGCPLLTLAAFLPELKAAAGRMNPVDCGQKFNVYVDYAHTPGAFTKLFPMVKSFTKGRLIAVFGSAGERDIEKRAIQGSVADEHCSIIVLTEEDPRGEASMEIIDQIAQGIKHKKENSTLFRVPDRTEAIRKAFSLAEAFDTVLLLGKGHEKSIIYKASVKKWNEEAMAVKLLKEIYTDGETGR